jgi:L-alanine-DL-glutamate epimerase-like enolase superfamily enzyme
VYHAFTGLTLPTSAALHVLCASPNCILAHQAYPIGFLQHDIVATNLDFQNGHVAVPMSPGIGVRLEPSKLEMAARRYEQLGAYPLFDPDAVPTWVPSH